jgi:hypothetical protein
LFWEFFLQKNIGAKAACKMLVKLTTVVNFINGLRAHFSCEILVAKNYKAKMKLQSQTFQLCKFWRQNIGEKKCTYNVGEIDYWTQSPWFRSS